MWGATKKNITEVPSKNTQGDKSHRTKQRKYGAAHLQIYNNDEYLKALQTIFRNPSNQEAKARIEHFNGLIGQINKKNDLPPLTGVNPIGELQKFYMTALLAIKNFQKGETEAEKAKAKKQLESIFETSKSYVQTLELPRSFSWPSPDPTREPYFWRDADKKREGVNDGVLTIEELEQRKPPPGQDPKNQNTQVDHLQTGSSQHNPPPPETPQHHSQTGSSQHNPPPPGNSQLTAPRQGHGAGSLQQGGGHVPRSSFVGFREAKRDKTTWRGYRMLAARPVGDRARNAWLIIVNEGSNARPEYRMCTGRECGGRPITKGIVDKLPRLGQGDKELIAREAKAETCGFQGLFGVVQYGADQTYCLTKWEADKEPRWISRSTFIKAIGSDYMVDEMCEEFGAQLPMKKAEKQQLLANTQQLLIAGNPQKYQAPPINAGASPQQLLMATDSEGHQAPSTNASALTTRANEDAMQLDIPQLRAQQAYEAEAVLRLSRYLKNKYRAFRAPCLEDALAQVAMYG